MGGLTTQPSFRKWGWRILTAILIFLAVGSFWYWRNQQHFGKAFNQYHALVTPPLQQVIDSIEHSEAVIPVWSPVTRLISGLEAFKKKNFGAAAMYLGEVPGLPSAFQPYQNLYLGRSLLAQRQYKAAIAPLQAAALSSTPAIQEEARFYLALIYSRTPWEKPQARKIWKELSVNEKSAFREAAQGVLE